MTRTCLKMLDRLRNELCSDTQIAEAVGLHETGWSLARIANRFGVYPQSIRYHLQRAGLTLRPRPGWPPNEQ